MAKWFKAQRGQGESAEFLFKWLECPSLICALLCYDYVEYIYFFIKKSAFFLCVCYYLSPIYSQITHLVNSTLFRMAAMPCPGQKTTSLSLKSAGRSLRSPATCFAASNVISGRLGKKRWGGGRFQYQASTVKLTSMTARYA